MKTGFPEHETSADDGTGDKKMNFDFLEEEPQEFNEPQIDEEDLLEFVDDLEDENGGTDEPKIHPAKARAEARRSAQFWVDMGSGMVSGVMAAYAGTDSAEFKLEKDQKEAITKPLTEMINDKVFLELSAKEQFYVALLMVYSPMAIKAYKIKKEDKEIKGTVDLKDKSNDSEKSGNTDNQE